MKRIVALTLLATLAVCAPAAAKPPSKLIRWTYAITVKGEARYHHVVNQPAVGGTYSTEDNLAFSWKSKMPRFQLLQGRVLRVGAGPVKFKNVEAKRFQSVPDPQGAPATGECNGTAARSGNAALVEKLLRPIDIEEGDATLELTPFSGVAAAMTCVGKLNGPGEIRIEDTTRNGAIFGIDFDLPHDAIGNGKIIQLFSEAPERCPGQEVPYTVACVFDMKGEITLRKIGKKVFGPARR